MANMNEIKTEIGTVFWWHATRKSDENKRDFETKEVTDFLETHGFSRNQFIHGTLGQPLLNTIPETHISISHSNGWFAVYLATTPVGVDIQILHHRMEAGRDYFMNEKEEKWKSTTDLHLVWAAKEALFKQQQGEETDPRKEFSICTIDTKQQRILAEYREQVLELKFQLNEEYVLVYSV